MLNLFNGRQQIGSSQHRLAMDHAPDKSVLGDFNSGMRSGASPP
jgi:hypothetical protein